jgi:hypothetical protein
MSLAEVLIATSRLVTNDAAHTFSRAGIPIFPCAKDGKRPLTAAGFLEASRDVDQVRAWWARWPRANIGMPTGSVSGFDVVDIDITGDGSGFAAFDRANAAGLLDGGIARVRTPSAGMHVYFPALTARPQRCWQAAAAHIDFRGSGGYVIVPPSTLITDTGRVSYRLCGVSAGGSKAIDAVALREFVDPRPAHAPAAPTAAALPEPLRLARWVSRLNEGERNSGLFWAACRLIEAGHAPAAVGSALGPAAQAAGLPESEITATISSATRQTSPSRPRGPGTAWCQAPSQGGRGGDAPCLS